MWEYLGVQVTARVNCIINLLMAFNLCERKSVVKIVTILKTRVDEGSGGSGKVKSVTDTTEVTNVVMAGAIKGRNLFRKR